MSKNVDVVFVVIKTILIIIAIVNLKCLRIWSLIFATDNLRLSLYSDCDDHNIIEVMQYVQTLCYCWKAYRSTHDIAIANHYVLSTDTIRYQYSDMLLLMRNKSVCIYNYSMRVSLLKQRYIPITITHSSPWYEYQLVM